MSKRTFLIAVGALLCALLVSAYLLKPRASRSQGSSDRHREQLQRDATQVPVGSALASRIERAVSLKGIVKAGDTPLAGVKIIATFESGVFSDQKTQVYTTNEDGRFALAYPNAASVLIRAEKTGYREANDGGISFQFYDPGQNTFMKPHADSLIELHMVRLEPIRRGVRRETVRYRKSAPLAIGSSIKFEVTKKGIIDGRACEVRVVPRTDSANSADLGVTVQCMEGRLQRLDLDTGTALSNVEVPHRDTNGRFPTHGMFRLQVVGSDDASGEILIEWSQSHKTLTVSGRLLDGQ